MVLVAAEGEIDIYTAPRLHDVLEEALENTTRRLIVDIAGVSFIDSTGLTELIGAFRRLRERGARLEIVGSQHNVTRVFTITGLTDAFTFYATREEALAPEDCAP